MLWSVMPIGCSVHLPEQELGPTAAEALALLALIAGQDVEPVEGSDGTDGRWQIARRVVPDRVISTVDPDTRHAHKSVQRRQDGFKAHLAIEPDTGIITDCALTKAGGLATDGAPVSEARTGLALLDGEDSPVRVLADSAYGSGEFRAELHERGHIDLVKPAPTRSAVPAGFTVDDFTVDHDNRTATCPNGLTRTISRTGYATFGVACAGCPLRANAPPVPPGEYWGSVRTTRCSAPLAELPETPSGRTNIGDTGRWSSGPSPGWCAATAKCAIAAWPKTTTGFTTEPPRSTCAD